MTSFVEERGDRRRESEKGWVVKDVIRVLLAVELLVGTIGLVLVAKQRKLQDVLVYGALTFVAILVTGIVGEALVSATLEQMSEYNRPADPHLGHWGAALSVIPFGVATVTGYALKFEAMRNPKVLVAATAMIGAGLGLLLSQYVPVFGGIEMNGEPWSEARLSLLPGHVLLFLVLGAAIGGFVVRRSSSPTSTK